MTDVSESLEFLNAPEHHLPFRVNVILEKIFQDGCFSESDYENFCRFTKIVLSLYHFDYHKILLDIKEAFVPFDPDADTLWEKEFSESELEEKREILVLAVRNLLTACNFVKLSSDELNRCLQLQPFSGLSIHVDKSDFDSFAVYYRGVRPAEYQLPFWQIWRNRTVQTRMLKRVFVVARYKNEKGGKVIFKLYKDVIVDNLKIVAPKVKLGLPIFDRLKIGGTVFGGIATSVYKVVLAAAFSPVLFMIVLSGLVLAALKGVFGFLNSRTKYLHIFSSSLYHQNLSNNTGAVAILVDMAEEQEVKEVLLGYFMLLALQKEGKSAVSIQYLDQKIEAWIEEHFNVRLDYEENDALRKLKEKRLVEEEYSETKETLYSPVSLSEALRRIDEEWDNIFLYNNEASLENNNI